MNKEMLTMIQEALTRLRDNPELMDIDELKVGIEVEKEHADLYNTLKEKFGDQMEMTLDEFCEAIARAHILEDKDYYKKLKIVGL